jgi:hypothetical protein
VVGVIALGLVAESRLYLGLGSITAYPEHMIIVLSHSHYSILNFRREGLE